MPIRIMKKLKPKKLEGILMAYITKNNSELLTQSIKKKL